MNSDNTMQQTAKEKQQVNKDSNYFAPLPSQTKQIINFKAQTQYQSADLVEDDDEGAYEL